MQVFGELGIRIPKAEPSTPTVSSSASVLTSTESPQSITDAPARKPPSMAEAHCRRLVDLTAETIRYANQTGGLVTREDARAIAITVYIQAGYSKKLRWNEPKDTRRAG